MAVTEPLPAAGDLVTSVRRLLRPGATPSVAPPVHREGDGAVQSHVFGMRVALGGLGSPPPASPGGD